MDLELNLREEAPSHGPSPGGGPTAPQPLSTASSSTTTTAAAASSSSSSSSATSTATREALDEELASRIVADDQRARYGAFSAAAAGEGPSDAAQRAAAAFQASAYGTAPGHQPDTTPQKPGELSAGPSATAERVPVPLQPRPTAYAQFQAGVGGGGGGGASGLGVPLRPAAGKARSNSWSYPASAVAPYAVHPYAASSGIGTGMPAPNPAQPRTNRAATAYRQRSGSLSFSSPDDETMRQQYLQQQQQHTQQGPQMFLPYTAPQPTSQPMMAQDSSFLAYGGGGIGGGVGDGGGFLSAYQQHSRAPQPVTAAQATPPLPTTPSSFIRRTSLPQTYLHTIPISRSASSGFTPASTDTALPITAQPQTTEVHQKLEIPTQGARALPKEIATHPAIQSITKSQSDSQQATGEAEAEKEAGVEITGEEGEAGGVQPSEGKFVDISEYLNLPQSKVAKTLGIPSSTLSKRWKEAARARKWPWRTVCKIDKEIMALLHNIPPSVAAKGPEHVPPEINTRLLALLKQRQDELKPVIIRL